MCAVIIPLIYNNDDTNTRDGTATMYTQKRKVMNGSIIRR